MLIPLEGLFFGAMPIVNDGSGAMLVALPWLWLGVR